MLTSHQLAKLSKSADEYVGKVLEVVSARKGGHLGGSTSLTQFLCYYYLEKYGFNNENSRIILSKGHAALGVYVLMSMAGLVDFSEVVAGFNSSDRRFAMFPHRVHQPQIFELAGGSLGLGSSLGIGMALGLRRKGLKTPVFCILGDGECNEGSVWEGFMSAAHFGLANLIFIIDSNKFSMDGELKKIMSLGDLDAKLKSFGMDVHTINGHDFTEIDRVLDLVLGETSVLIPKAIVLDTVKGFGVPEVAGTDKAHFYRPAQ